MKTNLLINLALAATVSILGACTTSRVAQQVEYDDMYYTAADREAARTAQQSARSNTARYQDNRQAGQAVETDDYYSQNTETEAYGDEEYYREDYNDGNYSQSSGSGSYITNNNFSPMWMNSGWGFYNSPMGFYDPFFYDPFVMNRAFYGVRPRISFNYGFGMGFGMGFYSGFGMGMGMSPYGFYDPFFSPWGWGNPYGMGMMGMYNPWGMGGFYSPWGMGGMYNPWLMNSYAYNMGVADGSLIGARNARVTTYGPRHAMANEVASVSTTERSRARMAPAGTTGVPGTRVRAIGSESANTETTNAATRPSRGDIQRGGTRGDAVTPADARPARDVNVIRPERSRATEGATTAPARTGRDFRGSSEARPTGSDYYRARPSRDSYSQPSRSSSPSRSYDSYSQPSRSSSPSRSPDSYSQPSRSSSPSRSYSSPSSPSYSSPSYSSPSRGSSGGGSYSAPSRGGGRGRP